MKREAFDEYCDEVRTLVQPECHSLIALQPCVLLRYTYSQDKHEVLLISIIFALSWTDLIWVKGHSGWRHFMLQFTPLLSLIGPPTMEWSALYMRHKKYHAAEFSVREFVRELT